MRETDVVDLLGRSDLPFVRHHLDPDATDRVWVRGRAVVTDGTVSRWADAPPGPVRTCLGPLGDLAPLMAQVDAARGAPWRVTVEEEAYDALPPAWRQDNPNRWHWMLTRATPTPPRPAPHPSATGPSRPPPVVCEVDDDTVEGVLAEANPDSFARPGTARVECWLGVRDGDTVTAVGALVRQADGTGHLRGISTRPAHRRRGHGRALSLALTARALAGGSGLATLGVYADNVPALAIYRGLGYTTVHTLRSGLVATR